MLRGRKRMDALIVVVFVSALLAAGRIDAEIQLAQLDPMDPEGNITIKWDVMSWTADGYVALVSMLNYQRYRHIEAPGWSLGWTWRKQEVIWDMVGAQATMQGDCSRFHGAIPHCCKRSPTIVDLLPGAPPSMQVANCCKSGVLSSPLQDKPNSVAMLQLTVGLAGNGTAPVNFTLGGPGPGYKCGPAVRVQSSLFPTPDGRRFTQALKTWNVSCQYFQVLAQKSPTCCVAFSAFYNKTIIPCQSCACQCSYSSTRREDSEPVCQEVNANYMRSPGYAMAASEWQTPELYCSWDMCPVKVHWHVKTNYYDYWRAKLTIINRSLQKNHSQWNMVVEHPNMSNLTEAFSFNYKSLSTNSQRNNTGVFYGIKYFNDILLTAGPTGNVQSELLFMKVPHFTLQDGWAFPTKVYFNGDECVLPPPGVYPLTPHSWK